MKANLPILLGWTKPTGDIFLKEKCFLALNSKCLNTLNGPSSKLAEVGNSRLTCLRKAEYATSIQGLRISHPATRNVLMTGTWDQTDFWSGSSNTKIRSMMGRKQNEFLAGIVATHLSIQQHMFWLLRIYPGCCTPVEVNGQVTFLSHTDTLS